MKEADPRMHTAEHVLNQTMDRMFGCGRCFSAHVEKKKSKCDYRFARPITGDEAREIEARMNEVLAADLPVTEDFLTVAAAGARFNLERLPEGATGVRIVRVGDYDACPCIGDHVESTGRIGRFRLTTHSFENGVLRIRFKLDDPPAAD